MESEAGAAVGLALPPHPDSSILTSGLRMTWWGAECGMGSSFESLRMSGLEAQEAYFHRNRSCWRPAPGRMKTRIGIRSGGRGRTCSPPAPRFFDPHERTQDDLVRGGMGYGLVLREPQDERVGGIERLIFMGIDHDSCRRSTWEKATMSMLRKSKTHSLRM